MFVYSTHYGPYVYHTIDIYIILLPYIPRVIHYHRMLDRWLMCRTGLELGLPLECYSKYYILYIVLNIYYILGH